MPGLSSGQRVGFFTGVLVSVAIFSSFVLLFALPIMHYLTPLKMWKLIETTQVKMEEADIQTTLKKDIPKIQSLFRSIKADVLKAEKIEKQLPRLQRIEQDKRSEYEIWKEELEAAEQRRKMSEEEEREFQREVLRKQRNNELMQQGLGIAGNVAGRMVQDRKKVTLSYEADKKKKK